MNAAMTQKTHNSLSSFSPHFFQQNIYLSLYPSIVQFFCDRRTNKIFFHLFRFNANEWYYVLTKQDEENLNLILIHFTYSDIKSNKLRFNLCKKEQVVALLFPSYVNAIYMALNNCNSSSIKNIVKLLCSYQSELCVCSS